ncbi:hypothetical protein [uncultured Corynebacterium sp.]|uniref:hypothetical protein n=1 Tax=uncultured Corynebacterium sp. TaxID=159447 RepID=UPI0025FE3382|nr:hypothetical protein [uncultured Corynebacterium sp.]
MNALNSRKAIVGVVVTALVVVLHVLTGGGLGFLWPVVAVCAGAAAGLVTPPKQPKAIEAPKSGPGELTSTLEGVRYALGRRQVPGPVQRAWDSFDESALWVLNDWRRLNDAPHQQALVRDMIEEHSTELVKSYLEVTDLKNPAAVKEMSESLDILGREMQEIRDAISQNSVRNLRNHSMALKLEYGGTLPSIESKEV